MLERFLGEFGADLAEVENLLGTNRIFVDRCENVGILTRGDAIAMGITGPILRAAGVPRETRWAALTIACRRSAFSNSSCTARRSSPASGT